MEIKEGFVYMYQTKGPSRKYQGMRIKPNMSTTFGKAGCGGYANAMGLSQLFQRPVPVTEMSPGFNNTPVMDAGLMSSYLNKTYGNVLNAQQVSSGTFRSSKDKVVSALKSGGYAVLHSRPDDPIWARHNDGSPRTKSGHYVVVLGYDPVKHPDKPFRVHDSAATRAQNTGWFTWEQVARGACGGHNMIVTKK